MLGLTSLFWDRFAVGAVHFAPIKHLYVRLSLAPPRVQVHSKSVYLAPLIIDVSVRPSPIHLV